MIDDIIAVIAIITFTIAILYSVNFMLNNAYEELSYYKTLYAKEQKDLLNLSNEIDNRSLAVLLYIKNSNLSSSYSNLSFNPSLKYYVIINKKRIDIR